MGRTVSRLLARGTTMSGNQVDHTQSADQAANEITPDDRDTSLRAMLLERRQALTREIDELIARHRSDQILQREQSVADTGDMSLQDSTGEQQISILEARNRMRNQIDEALRRLNEGTYGICEDCGRQVGPERLRAVPFARRCVECQQKAEVIERIEKEPDREEI
jgi:DnaK suppressor protein